MGIRKICHLFSHCMFKEKEQFTESESKKEPLLSSFNNNSLLFDGSNDASSSDSSKRSSSIGPKKASFSEAKGRYTDSFSKPDKWFDGSSAASEGELSASSEDEIVEVRKAS